LSFQCTVHTENTSVCIVPLKALRVVVLNDLHIPFHDPAAVSLTEQLLALLTPDIIVLNGDIIDFFAISRYSKDPRRKLMLGEELQQTRRFLERWDKLFSPALWLFLEGNHEERMRQYLWQKAPELSSLEELHLAFLLGIHGKSHWKYLETANEPSPIGMDIEPVVRFPELLIMHGGRIRVGGNTINIARSIFYRMLRNIVVGHWHRADSYIQLDYYGMARGCWVVPCLAYQRPHWDSGRIWGQGILVIEVNRDGFFKCDILNYIKVDGAIVAFWNGKEVKEACSVSGS